MKKLIAICAVALAAGAFADDSYLYWMLGDTLSWETGVSEPSYDAARVGVLSTDGTTTYLSLYDINANSVGDSTTKAYVFTSDAGTGTLAAQVASTYQTTGYSFFIELLNDGTTVGRSSDSSMLQWSALSAYTGTTLGGMSEPGNYWDGGTFTTAAIPEPTSGLLVLFGLSALALRRKRMA